VIFERILNQPQGRTQPATLTNFKANTAPPRGTKCLILPGQRGHAEGVGTKGVPTGSTPPRHTAGRSTLFLSDRPWSDAIPSCRLLARRADSRCVVRSLPNPEPRKAEPATRAGHNFPAEAGEGCDLDNRTIPQIGTAPQDPSE
jgi:hypothetical protein